MATRTAYAGTASSNDILTAANVNKLPGGWVGYVEKTSDQGSITSEADVTSLTLTLTLVSGRRYEVSAYLDVSIDTGARTANVAIYDGASRIQRAREVIAVAGDSTHMTPVTTLDGDGSSHTVKVTAQVQGGSGTMTVNAASDRPSHLLIKDVGPTS